MRITGSRMLELASLATSRAQTDVAELSAQLSSGKRVSQASDDPVAWAQARRVSVRKAMSEAFGDGLALGRDQLIETEHVLAVVGNVMAEAKQLAVRAANSSNSAADRRAMAEDARGLFQTALASANSKNVAGEYLFAGSASLTTPFDTNGVYAGDDARRMLEISDGIRSSASLSGASLTAAEGVDVLPALGRLIAALDADNLAAIQTAINELDTAHDQVAGARAQVGSMQAVLTDADQRRGELEDTMTARVAELTETDFVATASALAQATNALSAAQAINVRLAQLLSVTR